MSEATVKKSYSLLDMSFEIVVPADAAAYDHYAGREGACLDCAVDYFTYRRPATNFRKKFLERVAETTGIERETRTIGEGDKAKTTFVLTEKEYFEHVLSQEGVSKSQFAALAQEVADEISWLPTPASSGRVGQEWLNEADDVLAQVAANPENADALISNMSARGIVLSKNDEGTFDQTNLAIALKNFDAALKQEAKSQRFATAPVS